MPAQITSEMQNELKQIENEVDNFQETKKDHRYQILNYQLHELWNKAREATDSESKKIFIKDVKSVLNTLDLKVIENEKIERDRYYIY
ncbi:uncharacterized protein LOC126264323 [Aethina tumida]|uniref:uncharacterized protein LOC126264323 n=1 Tax=Aethina tumida TaxID=116153 RepID=UPI0021478CB0|nr:uncharacterized protein LOC126264323 [Aethina tumida]